jgi:hypothetical protein
VEALLLLFPESLWAVPQLANGRLLGDVVAHSPRVGDNARALERLRSPCEPVGMSLGQDLCTHNAIATLEVLVIILDSALLRSIVMLRGPVLFS